MTIAYIEDIFRIYGIFPAIVGILFIEYSQLNEIGAYLVLVPLRMVQEVKFEISSLDLFIHLLYHTHSHLYFCEPLWDKFILFSLDFLMYLTFFP
jgi:hypothetical protein